MLKTFYYRHLRWWFGPIRRISIYCLAIVVVLATLILLVQWHVFSSDAVASLVGSAIGAAAAVTAALWAIDHAVKTERRQLGRYLNMASCRLDTPLTDLNFLLGHFSRSDGAGRKYRCTRGEWAAVATKVEAVRAELTIVARRIERVQVQLYRLDPNATLGVDVLETYIDTFGRQADLFLDHMRSVEGSTDRERPERSFIPDRWIGYFTGMQHDIRMANGWFLGVELEQAS